MFRQFFSRNFTNQTTKKIQQYLSENQEDLIDQASIGAMVGGTIGTFVGLVAQVNSQTIPGGVAEKIEQMTVGGTVGAGLGAVASVGAVAYWKTAPFSIFATYAACKLYTTLEKRQNTLENLRLKNIELEQKINNSKRIR